MRGIIFVATMVIGEVAAFAQGTVVFNNRIPGILMTRVYATTRGSWQIIGNGPTDFPSGTTDFSGMVALAGSTWCAALRAAPGADAFEQNLVFSPTTTTFRTGTAAGFVAATTAILPNVSKDAAVATVQMFVWENADGRLSDPSAALNAWMSGTAHAGLSGKFNVSSIGGDFNVPPNLLGLRSFSVYVPEPTTFQLLAAGVTFSFILRRTRSRVADANSASCPSAVYPIFKINRCGDEVQADGAENVALQFNPQ